MKKVIIWLIAIVAIVLVVLNLNSSNENNDGLIKIGSIEPLTGFASALGEASKAGTELAIEDLKNEGLNIEVVFEDSEGKPDKAVSAAHKLINIDKVNALFSNLSGPSSAVSPVAKENKKLLVYSAFDPANLDSNPYAMKTFLNAVEECRVLSEYAKDKGFEKIAYLGVNLSFTQACVDEMTGVFGKDNVSIEASSNPGETDFRSSLQKLKDSKIGFAISYGYEPNYEAILVQNISTGANISLACIESDCYSDKIQKNVSLDMMNGHVLYDYQPSKEFVDKLRSKYDSSLNVKLAAIAYDAFHYMAYALKDCTDVACAMKNISNNKEYEAVLSGAGFNGDRSFDLKNEYFIVENGQKVKIDL